MKKDNEPGKETENGYKQMHKTIQYNNNRIFVPTARAHSGSEKPRIGK